MNKLVTNPSSPSLAPGGTGSGAVFLDVIFNPHVGFRELEQRPVWLLPLLLWSALNLAANFVLLDRLNLATIVRNQVEHAGAYITDEQVDAIVARSNQSQPATLAIAAVAPTLVALLIATVFWLSLLVSGTMTSYRRAFAATTHAFIPQCIAMLLTALLTLRFDSIESVFQSGTILKSHLGVLGTPDTAPALMTLLQSFDIFSLWTVILLGIGFAAVSDRRKWLSMSLAYGFWVAYVGLKVGVIFFTSR